MEEDKDYKTGIAVAGKKKGSLSNTEQKELNKKLLNLYLKKRCKNN